MPFRAAVTTRGFGNHTPLSVGSVFATTLGRVHHPILLAPFGTFCSGLVTLALGAVGSFRSVVLLRILSIVGFTLSSCFWILFCSIEMSLSYRPPFTSSKVRSGIIPISEARGLPSTATPVMSFLESQSIAARRSAVVTSPDRMRPMISTVSNECSSSNKSSLALLSLNLRKESATFSSHGHDHQLNVGRQSFSCPQAARSTAGEIADHDGLRDHWGVKFMGQRRWISLAGLTWR